MTRHSGDCGMPAQRRIVSSANRFVRAWRSCLGGFAFDPATAPRPLAVGGTVVQQLMGGRDVAPVGADVRVSRDTRRVSGIQSPKSLCDFRGPRAPRPAVYNRRGGLPVGLHADNTRLAGGGGGDGAI